MHFNCNWEETVVQIIRDVCSVQLIINCYVTKDFLSVFVIEISPLKLRIFWVSCQLCLRLFSAIAEMCLSRFSLSAAIFLSYISISSHILLCNNWNFSCNLSTVFGPFLACYSNGPFQQVFSYDWVVLQQIAYPMILCFQLCNL